MPKIVQGTRIGLPDLLRFFHAFLGFDMSPMRMDTTCPGKIAAVSGTSGISLDVDADSSVSWTELLKRAFAFVGKASVLSARMQVLLDGENADVNEDDESSAATSTITYLKFPNIIGIQSRMGWNKRNSVCLVCLVYAVSCRSRVLSNFKRIKHQVILERSKNQLCDGWF